MTQAARDLSVFQFSMALLRAGCYYIQQSIDAGEIRRNLKNECSKLIRVVHGIDRPVRLNAAELKDADMWVREFTEKDYISFANVLSIMAYLPEDKRLQIESFAAQLGNEQIAINKPAA